MRQGRQLRHVPHAHRATVSSGHLQEHQVPRHATNHILPAWSLLRVCSCWATWQRSARGLDSQSSWHCRRMLQNGAVRLVTKKNTIERFLPNRERRRQQLEARQNRNSVSGGESTIRRRAESFTGPSRHFSETYNRWVRRWWQSDWLLWLRTPWSTNAGDQQQQQPQQSAQQRWASNQSPIVMPQITSNAFDSPTHQRPEKKVNSWS